MLKAALDFSGSELSFAVVDAGGATVASCLVDLPGRDSSSLPVLVGEALRNASLTYDDVDAWTVGAGPGSFTALRVAAAFVLGVVQGKDKPVRGLPSPCGSDAKAVSGFPTASRAFWRTRRNLSPSGAPTIPLRRVPAILTRSGRSLPTSPSTPRPM